MIGCCIHRFEVFKRNFGLLRKNNTVLPDKHCGVACRHLPNFAHIIGANELIVWQFRTGFDGKSGTI